MLAAQDQKVEVARLGDAALIEALKRLLSQERVLSARLIVHIGEVDARGLYREHAYSSMFAYCVRALHMSEAEAYLRIGAARLCREFPRALTLLQAGELHLSAVKLLAPVLTRHNADVLLEAARFKSKRELELLLATRFEKPDVPNVIRKLPEKAAPTQVAAAPLALDLGAAAPESGAAAEVRAHTPSAEPISNPQPEPALQPLASASVRPSLLPLRPGRYKVQLTASQELHDKLRQARDLMRHELPDGDLAQVVERALDLLIAQRMKQRFAVGRKPRAARKPQAREKPEPHNRHIPHAVRREVLARDGALCTFVAADGQRCEERGWLQLHHEQPFGRGGPPTVDNIRVLCRSHNQLLAERDYSPIFIQQRIARARHERERSELVPGPGPGVS